MRIICCRHVDNLKHMIDEYSGLKYDSFEVIEDDLYGNWFNKFQMYDRFRDGENLYFDLDIVIYDRLPDLVRKDFTLLDDTWWKRTCTYTFKLIYCFMDWRCILYMG